MSTNSVINLYTLHSPLCFTPEYVGYFSAFRQFMHGVGGVTAIKAFGMCLADINVARLALLSYLGFLVMLGFSETLLLVFLSKSVSLRVKRAYLDSKTRATTRTRFSRSKLSSARA